MTKQLLNVNGRLKHMYSTFKTEEKEEINIDYKIK